MGLAQLSSWLWVPKYFDAQLEEYLLSDSLKSQRAECQDMLGQLWATTSSSAQNLREYLYFRGVTMTSSLANSLQIQGEVIFKEYDQESGQITDSLFMQVEKKWYVFKLRYREPMVKLVPFEVIKIKQYWHVHS